MKNLLSRMQILRQQSEAGPGAGGASASAGATPASAAAPPVETKPAASEPDPYEAIPPEQRQTVRDLATQFDEVVANAKDPIKKASALNLMLEGHRARTRKPDEPKVEPSPVAKANEAEDEIAVLRRENAEIKKRLDERDKSEGDAARRRSFEADLNSVVNTMDQDDAEGRLLVRQAGTAEYFEGNHGSAITAARAKLKQLQDRDAKRDEAHKRVQSKGRASAALGEVGSRTPANGDKEYTAEDWKSGKFIREQEAAIAGV